MADQSKPVWEVSWEEFVPEVKFVEVEASSANAAMAKVRKNPGDYPVMRRGRYGGGGVTRRWFQATRKKSAR